MKQPVSRSASPRAVAPTELASTRGGFIRIVIDAVTDAANPWNDGVRAPRDQVTGMHSG